jgi:hypothetical protein
MVLGVLMVASVLAGPAGAADAVLYEVTEAVKTAAHGQTFRSATAMLTGWAQPGTPLCPGWLAAAGIESCWVVVRAVGQADDVTGIGDVSGSFEVAIQDLNLADAPEIVILRGRMRGRIDLSPAFEGNRPLGSITGSFSGSGIASTVLARFQTAGTFTGTFRMPFSNAGQASYLLDDGTVAPAQAYEFSIGFPAVKLEVMFSEPNPLGQRRGRNRD